MPACFERVDCRFESYYPNQKKLGGGEMGLRNFWEVEIIGSIPITRTKMGYSCGQQISFAKRLI